MTTKDKQRAELEALLQCTTVRTKKCAPMQQEKYRQGCLPGAGPVPAYVYDDGHNHGNKAVAIIH